MAAIISIHAHPRWGAQGAAAVTGSAASIIIFPGIRYERPKKDARRDAAPDVAKKKPSVRGRGKTGA